VQTYEFVCDACRGQVGTVPLRRPLVEAGLPAYCPVCDRPMRRLFSVPQIIMRPGGWRAKPGDKDFEPDWNRARELGELKEDATPVARYDPAQDAIEGDRFPQDPERDRQLAQLIHQHWTEDLSDDTVRRREQVAAAVARGEIIPEETA
jgi:predicted nucleic acid-binding Zn ribbon protein